MSVFLMGLATLQRPAVSKVVRKLVLEGELEVGSFENINDICSSSTGTESTPRPLNWSESDGMFGLAIGGTVGSLTDLQEFSWKLQNAYIHPMLRSSLARHPTLSALTHLYPLSTTLPPRTHIPTTFVPAFQNLTSLSVLDIDGSRPPDDFPESPGIKKLKTLRLSWVDGNAYEKQKGAGVGGGLVHVFGARVRSLAASSGRGGGSGAQPTITEKAGIGEPLYPPGICQCKFSLTIARSNSLGTSTALYSTPGLQISVPTPTSTSTSTNINHNHSLPAPPPQPPPPQQPPPVQALLPPPCAHLFIPSLPSPPSALTYSNPRPSTSTPTPTPFETSTSSRPQRPSAPSPPPCAPLSTL
ncbi:hypothetical protein BGX38DRAFT_332350 [Terfezia claveryi]|nr:hypothetical protein BGX38DRAFT_332350 [Terfezia claveryi]